jgi:hypothetical protein
MKHNMTQRFKMFKNSILSYSTTAIFGVNAKLSSQAVIIYIGNI